MLDNLTYKFKNRNSKKNLKKEIEKLREQIIDLRHETIGKNRNGWITFTTLGSKPEEDDSLYQKVIDLQEYLGIEYSESKLAIKPKTRKTAK